MFKHKKEQEAADNNEDQELEKYTVLFSITESGNEDCDFDLNDSDEEREVRIRQQTE
jgi:hypothetical protein